MTAMINSSEQLKDYFWFCGGYQVNEIFNYIFSYCYTIRL